MHLAVASLGSLYQCLFKEASLTAPNVSQQIHLCGLRELPTALQLCGVAPDCTWMQSPTCCKARGPLPNETLAAVREGGGDDGHDVQAILRVHLSGM